LGERLNGIQEVVSSILISSTNQKPAKISTFPLFNSEPGFCSVCDCGNLGGLPQIGFGPGVAIAHRHIGYQNLRVMVLN
jgi:hypothetical protein